MNDLQPPSSREVTGDSLHHGGATASQQQGGCSSISTEMLQETPSSRDPRLQKLTSKQRGCRSKAPHNCQICKRVGVIMSKQYNDVSSHNGLRVR